MSLWFPFKTNQTQGTPKQIVPFLLFGGFFSVFGERVTLVCFLAVDFPWAIFVGPLSGFPRVVMDQDLPARLSGPVRKPVRVFRWASLFSPNKGRKLFAFLGTVSCLGIRVWVAIFYQPETGAFPVEQFPESFPEPPPEACLGRDQIHNFQLSQAQRRPRKAIVNGHNEGTLHIPPPILSRVFQELSRGTSLSKPGGGFFLAASTCSQPSPERLF